jgi:hypothetical protein
MEPETGTDSGKQEPAVPFTPQIRAGLPPEAAFSRAVSALGTGQSTAFPLNFVSKMLMGRYVERYSNATRQLTLEETSDRYVVTRFGDEPVKRDPTISAQLMELAMGQSTVISGPRVGTVRSVASALLKTATPMRFSVIELKTDECRVSRIELSAKDQRKWSRYRFGNIGPGGQFTLAQSEHSGIDSMRANCTYHSKARGLVFRARENIDGSITIRCYAVGGMPPQWVIDKDHVATQERIAAKQAGAPGDAGAQQDAAEPSGCVG